MWVSKRVISIAAGVVAIVAMLTLAGFAAISVSTTFHTGVIVIDAGHGGIDGGVSYGDMVEKVLALDISYRLKSKLESKGFKVVMTRTGDEALADGKKADMQARKEVIEKAKANLVISIHINKFTSSSRRGVQVFYDDTEKNKELGERMQSILNTHINTPYIDRGNLEAIGGDYYITKCTERPSIIIECGFISNSNDRVLLKTDKYKDDLADCIAMGAESLFANK